jgi:integrase
MALDKIDRESLEMFLAEMLTKTVGKMKRQRTSRNGTLEKPRLISAKRVKNILGTLHTILRSTVKWGVLEKLPEFPQVRCPSTGFDFYDAAEAALLIASAREDERTLILFAPHTSARAGEQLALEWPDVDMRLRRQVSFSKSRTNGVTTQTTSGPAEAGPWTSPPSPVPLGCL